MTVSRWSCDVCDVCFSGLTLVIINHNTLCDKISLDYMCNGFCLSDLQRFFQGGLNSVLRISVQSWHTPRKECVVLLHTLFYCVIIKHTHTFPSMHCCKTALHKTCEKLFNSSLVLSTGQKVVWSCGLFTLICIYSKELFYRRPGTAVTLCFSKKEPDTLDLWSIVQCMSETESWVTIVCECQPLLSVVSVLISSAQISPVIDRLSQHTSRVRSPQTFCHYTHSDHICPTDSFTSLCKKMCLHKMCQIFDLLLRW